ncbi:MAG: GNAT family N-acetyltransferase [bacterium]|nr:GNAT family N-acetyltransferase [bacterium]
MAKLDMEKTTFQEVLKTIKDNYKNYGKEYNLYSYYHYHKNKTVGVVYGWYMKNYLFIDIVYVKEEYRKKGIATCMLKNVIKEMKENKKVDKDIAIPKIETEYVVIKRKPRKNLLESLLNE